MLAKIVLWLTDFPEIAAEIGRRAAGYVSKEHAIANVASAYWEVLSNLIP